MKSIMPFVVSIICIGALLGCAPVSLKHYTKKGLEPLTSNQIQSALIGRSIQLESIDFNATVSYNNDQSLSAKNHTGSTDTGRWSLEGENTLCMEFSTWHYGDKQCYRIISDKDDFIFFSLNGALVYTGSNADAILAASTRNSLSQEVVHRSKPATRIQTSPAQEAETPVERKNRFIRLAKNCPGCNLSGVDLSGAQLNRANLAGANLQGVNLTDAELRLANLQGADLTGAILVRANLPGADLSSSNLTDADFSGSNLIRANVSDATINNTNVTGAYLESIQGKIQ